MSKLNVAVVFGGRSAEHEVSVQSAKNVFDSLDKNKYNPVLIAIDREGHWFYGGAVAELLDKNNSELIQLNRESNPEAALISGREGGKLIDLHNNKTISDIDVVFPVLHGPYGEDGSIQGLAKLADLPCVGAGILGSSISMDKDVMKRLLRDSGISIGDFLVFRRNEKIDFDMVFDRLGSPLYVKPANLGSSVGISRAAERDALKKAVGLAFEYDTKIIIEKNITGREIEVSVLGNLDPLASIPGEIAPKDGFYSYDSKYLNETGASLIIPARLSGEEQSEIQETAIRVYKTLCVSGMARVDLFFTKEGEIFVNEINTLPGFTKISMYPKLWKESGISYAELVDRLIELAIEEFSVRTDLKTSIFG